MTGWRPSNTGLPACPSSKQRQSPCTDPQSPSSRRTASDGLQQQAARGLVQPCCGCHQRSCILRLALLHAGAAIRVICRAAAAAHVPSRKLRIIALLGPPVFELTGRWLSSLTTLASLAPLIGPLSPLLAIAVCIQQQRPRVGRHLGACELGAGV